MNARIYQFGSATYETSYTFARDHDCDEVKFDRDGPVVEGLPTYEW